MIYNLNSIYNKNALYMRIINRAIRGLYYKAYIKKSVSMSISMVDKDVIVYEFIDNNDNHKWNRVVFLFDKEIIEIRVRALFPFMSVKIKKHDKNFICRKYEFNEIIKKIRI